VVGERSAGDGRESGHDDSPDVTTDDDMDEETADSNHQVFQYYNSENAISIVSNILFFTTRH